MSKKIVTSKEVLQHVYQLVVELRKQLDYRDIYFAGSVPALVSECYVIRHTAGRSGEIQEGVVTVLIYTEPIIAPSDGRQMEDMRRTRDIERKAQDWVESLPTGEYLFWSDDTIQTDYDPEAGLYFTSIRLKYKHY